MKKGSNMKKSHVTSLGTNKGGCGRNGINFVFKSAAFLAISSSSFSNSFMAWVNVREPEKQWNNIHS